MQHMLTQRRWRIAGAICLAASAGMAYFGVNMEGLRASPAYFFGYWGLFLLLFLAAIYCALLDFRYVRLQTKIEERELYRQTLGDEQFRRALRQAQEEEAAKRK